MHETQTISSHKKGKKLCKVGIHKLLVATLPSILYEHVQIVKISPLQFEIRF